MFFTRCGTSCWYVCFGRLLWWFSPFVCTDLAQCHRLWLLLFYVQLYTHLWFGLSKVKGVGHMKVLAENWALLFPVKGIRRERWLARFRWLLGPSPFGVHLVFPSKSIYRLGEMNKSIVQLHFIVKYCSDESDKRKMSKLWHMFTVSHSI